MNFLEIFSPLLLADTAIPRDRLLRAGRRIQDEREAGRRTNDTAKPANSLRARIMRMEPTEIHEFSQQMKEAGESSLTGVSLAISILAVLVAMVTVLGHRTHTRAVLMQTRAADKWNEYQSRRTRTENLQVTVDLLTLQPVSDPAATRKTLDDYHARIAKWTAEVTDDQTKARELETKVEHAEDQAARYDLGEALLQIAVVLSSITLLTRHRGYFYFGLCLGIGGLLVAGSAVFLH